MEPAQVPRARISASAAARSRGRAREVAFFGIVSVPRAPSSLPPARLQAIFQEKRPRLSLTKSKSRRAAARTHELPARCFLAEHRKLGRFHTGSEHRRRTDHHVPAGGKRMEHLTSPSVALAPCGEQSVFAALGFLDEPSSFGASFTRRASTYPLVVDERRPSPRTQRTLSLSHCSPVLCALP